MFLHAALLAAGLGKNPHGDDKKDGSKQHEFFEFRPDWRTAPKGEPERHQDHEADTAALTSVGMATLFFA
jgi:hypothetical protein